MKINHSNSENLRLCTFKKNIDRIQKDREGITIDKSYFEMRCKFSNYF